MTRWQVRATGVLGGALVLVASVACAAPASTRQRVEPATSTSVEGGLSASTTAARPAAAGPRDAARSSFQSPPAPGAPAPPTPTPESGGDANPQLPIVQSLNRMIVYTADVTLLIDDLDTFPDRVGTVVLARGGYVAGIETRDDGGIPTTVVRLKVPPQQYAATMSALRGLAVEVRNQQATTQDVTEEYSDTQTQIASLEATHAQLLELMQRSGSLEEVLKVQQQAAQVRLQIDRLKGRAAALERLSALATITARGQLASAVLRRDFTAERAALRRAEATRASLEQQLKRVRTAEEEAGIRDRLGEVQLELDRRTVRLADLAAKAAAIQVVLPASEITTAAGGFEVPGQIRSAWEASLVFLLGVASTLVFLWWLVPLGVAALLALRGRGLGFLQGASRRIG